MSVLVLVDPDVAHFSLRVNWGLIECPNEGGGGGGGLMECQNEGGGGVRGVSE